MCKHIDSHRSVRGRADLPGAHQRRRQDRPEHLLRGQVPPTHQQGSRRDQTLKAGDHKGPRRELRGPGRAQDARCGGPAPPGSPRATGRVSGATPTMAIGQGCRRAPRGRSRGPLHHRAAVRAMGLHSTRRAKVAHHDPLRAQGAVPRGPGGPPLQRVQTQRAVSGRHHLCAHHGRVGGAPALVTDVCPRRIIGWQTTRQPARPTWPLTPRGQPSSSASARGAGRTGLVHHLRPRGAAPRPPATARP